MAYAVETRRDISPPERQACFKWYNTNWGIIVIFRSHMRLYRPVFAVHYSVQYRIFRSPKEETYERFVVFRNSRGYQQARCARGPFRFSPCGYRRTVRGRPGRHPSPLLGRAVRIDAHHREGCSSVPWKNVWPVLWNSIRVR